MNEKKEQEENIPPDAEEIDAHHDDTNQIETEMVAEEKPPLKEIEESDEDTTFINAITLLQLKNNSLLQLKEKLSKAIEMERNEIAVLKKQLKTQVEPVPYIFSSNSANLDEIMDLLSKENQILQIKKINLVRQIMEQEEMCIDIKAKISLLGT